VKSTQACLPLFSVKYAIREIHRYLACWMVFSRQALLEIACKYGTAVNAKGPRLSAFVVRARTGCEVGIVKGCMIRSTSHEEIDRESRHSFNGTRGSVSTRKMVVRWIHEQFHVNSIIGTIQRRLRYNRTDPNEEEHRHFVRGDEIFN